MWFDTHMATTQINPRDIERARQEFELARRSRIDTVQELTEASALAEWDRRGYRIGEEVYDPEHKRLGVITGLGTMIKTWSKRDDMALGIYMEVQWSHRRTRINFANSLTLVPLAREVTRPPR